MSFKSFDNILLNDTAGRLQKFIFPPVVMNVSDPRSFLIGSTGSWRLYLHRLAWCLGIQQLLDTRLLTPSAVTRSD